MERKLELLLARAASEKKTEEAAEVSHMFNRTRLAASGKKNQLLARADSLENHFPASQRPQIASGIIFQPSSA